MNKHLLAVLCISSLAALPACKCPKKGDKKQKKVKHELAYNEELARKLALQEQESAESETASESESKEDIAKF